MRKFKSATLILGLALVAVWGLGQWPAAASAAPLKLGFTSTPVPPTNTPLPPTDTPVPPTSTPLPPTNTPEPPAQPPAPIVYDPLVTKLVNLEQAQIGDGVRYTIVVTNPNSVELTNVAIVDPLPTVVDFVSTAPPQGAYDYNADTHTLTFNLGTLAPGQTLQIIILARVNNKAQPPVEFKNIVNLTWDGGGGSASNPVNVLVIPAGMPAAGLGPGWREMMTMALAGLAGLGLLGLGLTLTWRRFHAQR